MSTIKFTINGKQHSISSSIEAETTLNTYLRDYANLRGTKFMCREGGCGVCVVAASIPHPVTKKKQTLAVNSCLVSVLSCHGWDIHTVEGIGNRHDGYHKVQSRLASFNGTQCGFCSPGWVMNMYSLLEENENGLTMKEVENSFAGNLCRCTGYRSILDAFKSFSSNADPALLQKVADIEDIENVKMCNKTGTVCMKTCDDYSEEGFCKINMDKHLCDYVFNDDFFQIDHQDKKWFKVYTIKDIFDIFNREGTSSYMLVAGNTARGVYHVDELPKVMIDITSVSVLKSLVIDADLSLGGAMTLNEMMKTFQEVARNKEYFEYTQQMYRHLDLVAHIPVRNIGTIAGNLSIKHQFNEFPSDLFLLFATVGATLTILENETKELNVTLPDYLKMNMKGKVIYSVNLPPLTSDYVFQSYKIMPRAQNAHAHINAGFLFKFNHDKTSVESASIVYGGINSKFIHATATENFLKNKNIFKSDVMKLALQTLAGELFPENSPPEPSPEYRKKLAVALLYKCLLHINPGNDVNPLFKSGGEEFDRPVSSAKQTFETNKDIWPLNQPIPKIEAYTQCSGEAAYINDIPTMPGELHAAFVQSTIYTGTIDKIDKESAMSNEGVVAVFTAEDIPGINNFVSAKTILLSEKEEILCSKDVLYYGQPVAIVVAESDRLARLAAKNTKVTYKNANIHPPVTNIKDALKAPDSSTRIKKDGTNPNKTTGNDIKKIINGSFDIYAQNHFTMETMSCVCIPIEDGLDVYPATQYMDLTHLVVSDMLKIPENNINIKIRRLGGAYGSKISRSSQVIAACALGAYKLNRPVRFVLPLETHMSTIGKRVPLSCDYEVAVNDEGKIQYLKNTFYQDNGCSRNENMTPFTQEAFDNCYDDSTWSTERYSVLTDTPSNTWCRAPGSTEGIAMIENIMEHIATELQKDPMTIRLNNMTKDNKLISLVPDFKQSIDYDKRVEDVKNFNKSNRWRKRGISMTPMDYRLMYFGNFASLVSIYRGDGTVTVSHGGIEMGQGLNTKVAQVCAHVLGISVDMVTIKPTNNLTAPNAIVSGGSIASEVCCYATKKACEMLLERLEPIKKAEGNISWPELIQKAYMTNVDLCAHYMFTTNDDVKPYNIYGLAAIEVEVDMLTGNHQILRVDILEDVGQSISPIIDVGQVEGAYIMGLGYWTTEHVVYDKKTGELLTDRSWNYKPLGIKDIPQDFRVNFQYNAPNPLGILRSKATGEPSLCMAVGITFALRQAIQSARVDNGHPPNEWATIKMPLTAENIILAIDNNISEFKY